MSTSATSDRIQRLDDRFDVIGTRLRIRATSNRLLELEQGDRRFISEAAASISDALDDCEDELLIAVALTRFSVDYEQVDPELAEHAWQLAADRLLKHNFEPGEEVREVLL